MLQMRQKISAFRNNVYMQQTENTNFFKSFYVQFVYHIVLDINLL